MCTCPLHVKLQCASEALPKPLITWLHWPLPLNDALELAEYLPSRMKHFVDVTDGVIKRILAPANIEAMSALDGDRQLTPLSGQARIFGSYYDSVDPMIRSWLGKYGIEKAPPKSFFECMTFVVDAMRAMQRLGFGSYDEAYQDLTHIDQALYALLSKRELKEMFRRAALIERGEFERILQDSFKADPDLDPDDLRDLLKVTDEQIESRSSILADADRPASVSKGYDEWCNVTREVLEMFVWRKRILEEVISRVFLG